MAKRTTRVGQWVLPVAAVFLTLVVLWAVLAILRWVAHVGDHSAFVGNVFYVLSAMVFVAGCATVTGIAFLLLAIFQQVQLNDPGQSEQLLRRHGQLLEQVSEGLMLSDRAKAVAYREKERDALRRAIHEDLAKQDWEAAYHLIDEMRRSFGYRGESERLRVESDQRRRDAIRANLAKEMSRFRECVTARDWAGAHGEAELLMARYPDERDVQSLLDELNESREIYKRRLLSQFKQAIDRSEFDRGVEILRELDQYLTPGEAAGLQESARGVFRGKLHNLGVQFSIAISGRDWAEAVTIGDEIVHEFPNSKYAEEVRQTRDALVKRAAGANA